MGGRFMLYADLEKAYALLQYLRQKSGSLDVSSADSYSLGNLAVD